MIIVNVYNAEVIDPDEVKRSEKIWTAIRTRSSVGVLNIGITYHKVEECHKGNPTLAITVEDDPGEGGKTIARNLAEVQPLVLFFYLLFPPPPLADSVLLLDQGGESGVTKSRSPFPALVKAGWTF